jgi:hypothetical protein
MGSWDGALIWIGLLSSGLFVGSIALIWILIVGMPVDYLTRDQLTSKSFFFRHPVLRVIAVVVRNLVGLLLVVMGFVMLLTPGQGVLSICVGITLLDFPGKHTLIRRMLGRPRVLNVINKIRSRARKPPLETPED